MRIKSLELVNDPKVKNLKLDFTVDSNVQDTIILAGNNGCGKTTILDNIYLLINDDIAHNLDRDDGLIKSVILLNDNEKDFIKNNLFNSDRTPYVNDCLTLLEKTNELEHIVDFSAERHSYERHKFFAIMGEEKKRNRLIYRNI